MPFYRCEIVRIEYYKAEIIVEAGSKGEAEEVATDESNADDFDLTNASQWVKSCNRLTREEEGKWAAQFNENSQP
jgi:hypothetical protein